MSMSLFPAYGELSGVTLGGHMGCGSAPAALNNLALRGSIRGLDRAQPDNRGCPHQHCHKVTRGAGSRTQALAMVFKLVESTSSGGGP
jgi:hypothetical protein